MSPTERTLAECRRRDWLAAVVEKWLPARGGMSHGRRQDLFGCIDVVAIAPGELGVLGVQATSRSNVSSRLRKAQDETQDVLCAWLRAGNAFEVWGWGKRAKPVGRRYWRCRRVALVLRGGRLTRVDLQEV